MIVIYGNDLIIWQLNEVEKEFKVTMYSSQTIPKVKNLSQGQCNLSEVLNFTLHVSVSPSKDRFPVRELMTSQRLRSFTWESTQDRTIPTLKFLGKSTFDLPLFSRQRSDRRVSKPMSGFKVHRMRSDKNQ
ncbi:hypothetical protein TNCV_1135801 [Trichonephila clavipes]|nr:hypothetical protein TNCV_1135801 [Trichonephila clavipes]